MSLIASAASASTSTPSVCGVTSVRPLNSLTVPVTSTKSPISTSPTKAEPNTKTPSDAPGVASGVPPEPSVWM